MDPEHIQLYLPEAPSYHDLQPPKPGAHRMDGSNQASSPLKDHNPRHERNHVTRREEKAAAREDTCSICLENISERAIAYPCNHVTFDFLCLVSWLQEQEFCPLCKSKVLQVQYDWRSPDDYKTYHVPSRRPRASRNSHNTTRPFHRPSRPPPAPNSSPLTLSDPALERRRHVYRHRLHALYTGANSLSGYRDFTPSTIIRSPEHQSRARAFLRRELRVFSFLDASRRGSREFLVEFVLGILRTQDLRGSENTAEDMLKDHLGRENARLLLHELETWLRSPFARLEEWDGGVQYMDGRGVFLLKDSTADRAKQSELWNNGDG
ncbi:hypothetical protein MBLNU230_g1355t1 [Neophaeotheca triangularis]